MGLAVRGVSKAGSGAWWSLIRQRGVSHSKPITGAYSISEIKRVIFSYGAVRCRTVSYGVCGTAYGVARYRVSCGAVRCRAVPYGAVRCRAVSYGVLRCRAVSYGAVRRTVSGPCVGPCVGPSVRLSVRPSACPPARPSVRPSVRTDRRTDG